ncbi:hypothetical protein BU24DRAFT_42358 [Aaosphaeria arxii CBS 175.79]|uniref:Uncharacterized protein n=1 Tax=Aaosphaeria arxii CBS 175.79 TaxID=1450172 RepID=A0A6A5Y9Q5_9PLEO|nr:uncharacterized protein BU24DRAFT_42358 [Aaosphaeria arxii CBS 175.79]KAF2022312.1 hypothetical protein BU24DRAFT_42358 [Aaosphaeria arxii CBS 175.79]
MFGSVFGLELCFVWPRDGGVSHVPSLRFFYVGYMRERQWGTEDILNLLLFIQSFVQRPGNPTSVTISRGCNSYHKASPHEKERETTLNMHLLFISLIGSRYSIFPFKTCIFIYRRHYDDVKFRFFFPFLFAVCFIFPFSFSNLAFGLLFLDPPILQSFY